MIASVFLFAVVIYVTGLATVQLATGRYRLNFETHVMCTGVGLGVFAVMTVLLNTLGVRLTWWSFTLSACGLFLTASLRDIISKDVSKHARTREPFWTKDCRFLIVAVALAALMFAVFLHGAFLSKWLIDGDSWLHAASAKWVTIYHTYSVPIDVRHGFTCYLEPYPPAYPVLMGVLHQLNPSIFWTLKFFNVLIVSLSVVYFYLMLKEWTKRPAAALWMTGVVWILPCFMSHFIWSQTMSLAMFFPAFWALERSRNEPRWNVVAAVVVAGMFLTQPSSPVVFMLMALIYLMVNFVFARTGREGAFTVREVVCQAVACAAGALFSLIHYVPAFLKFGYGEFFRGIMRVSPEKVGLKVSGVGCAFRYGLWDFIWAPTSARINQPTGVGLVLFGVLCAGFVLLFVGRRETTRSRWKITALAWLVFTVLGVLAEYLPVSLFPHRFWVFMAMPVAMIAGWTFSSLTSVLGKKNTVLAVIVGAAVGSTIVLTGLGEAVYRIEPVPLDGQRLLATQLAGLASLAAIAASLYFLIRESADTKRWCVFSGTTLLIAGVALTSGFAKVSFQGFSAWDAGRGFYRCVISGANGEPAIVQNDLYGYAILREESEPNMPVLGLTCSEARIIGFDMFTPPFDMSLKEFREALRALPIERIDESLPKRIYAVATSRKFEFVSVDHHWGSFPMLRMLFAQRRMKIIRQQCGMDRERMEQFLAGAVIPTHLEEPFVARLRKEREIEKAAIAEQERVVKRVARLCELLDKSPLFEKQFDVAPFGVALFMVKPDEEASAP